MKHHIYYSLILLLFMLTGFRAEAQNTKLYSFAIKSTDQLLTYNQGSLSMTDIRTGINSLAQNFIVKRLGNGNVLIAPAANPGLLLKRDGNTIIFAVYTANDSDFEWQLLYSGYPYLSIAAPGVNNFLSWQSGSGFGMVTPGALNDNDDSSGNYYRFGLSNVTNTF